MSDQHYYIKCVISTCQNGMSVCEGTNFGVFVSASFDDGVRHARMTVLVVVERLSRFSPCHIEIVRRE